MSKSKQKSVSVKVRRVPDELIKFVRGTGIHSVPKSVKALLAAFAENRVSELVLNEPEPALVERLNKHFSGE